MAATKVYMIVLMDSASDSYNYGVYEDEESPNKVYTSLDAAKQALISISEKYDEFLPTAYGMAFPYDSVTFDEQLESETFAPWGWGVLKSEDGVQRICVGIISLIVN
jgi:hypothetical protein